MITDMIGELAMKWIINMRVKDYIRNWSNQEIITEYAGVMVNIKIKDTNCLLILNGNHNHDKVLKDVYNVTKDRYLKKKVHEGIFSILYVLEFGINEEFKDSTTYANEYMRIKSEMVEKNTEEQVQEDLASSIKRFDQFNNWLLKCTKITPYPLSKEFYGIASKSYKFQTSMALILPALYKKIYDEKVLGDISFEKAIEMIQKAMLGSFIEDPHYTASSTNSKEIKKLVNSFGKEN